MGTSTTCAPPPCPLAHGVCVTQVMGMGCTVSGHGNVCTGLNTTCTSSATPEHHEHHHEHEHQHHRGRERQSQSSSSFSWTAEADVNAGQHACFTTTTTTVNNGGHTTSYTFSTTAPAAAAAAYAADDGEQGGYVEEDIDERGSTEDEEPDVVLEDRPARVQMPTGRDEPTEKGSTACAVCMTNKVKVALIDCGHAVMCVGCARTLLRDEHPRCPVCRAPIKKGALTIFM
eukprot:TRINITY_DN1968_c0_g1_i1.p2 TRINITY_DN1968_c0_g1~~TRINITY_DN1968_c0_g1_i1.p2  ORF type:complete len:230 (+),score=47.83 TRINITY_DN1968_c0_g1_i1:219-908(+)